MGKERLNFFDAALVFGLALALFVSCRDDLENWGVGTCEGVLLQAASYQDLANNSSTGSNKTYNQDKANALLVQYIKNCN